MKIIGNTVGMGLPKPNLAQTNPKKGDYVKGKNEFVSEFIDSTLTQSGKAADAETVGGKFKQIEEYLEDCLSNFDNVFVGDETTSSFEYFEEFNEGKVCFMKRNRGGSGLCTWMLVNANASQARFYSIDPNGNVMYGTLKADGTVSDVA